MWRPTGLFLSRYGWRQFLIEQQPGASLRVAKRPCGNGSPPPEGLAPMLAPTLGDSGQFETTPDKTAGDADGAESPTADDVSGAGVKQKHPLPCADSGCDLVDLRGFEPLTSALRTQRSPN